MKLTKKTILSRHDYFCLWIGEHQQQLPRSSMRQIKTYGQNNFPRPFCTQILHKVHLLAQQNLSSCSCGHFRDLLKSPHPTISLCPAPMFFNNFNKNTEIIPPTAPNTALQKNSSNGNMSACLSKGQMSHNIGKILAEMEWS